jgi:lipopolysaccharide transport system ATP-binding protein
MSNIAIRAENLGKRYKIGKRIDPRDTLREHLTLAVKSLFSRNGHSSTLDSQLSTLTPQLSTLNSQPSDHIWALKDVSFEIKHGEVVGFIGKNGAGKSTLLKILSQITEPTTGKAEIFGRVGSLLEVGTGFHAELTGRENIYLNGAILGMKKTEIDKKFDEIVSFSEIERFIDTPVKRYSTGMYVRLAFGVAAHLEPEILIVDEVLAVGDGAFQRKCLGKMQDVAGNGRTVLFVSHNMLAVQKLCSRCVFLEHGLLRASGATTDIIDHYLGMDVSDVYVDKPDGIVPRIVSARVLTPVRRTNVPIDLLIEWFLPQTIPGIKLGLGLCTIEGQTVFDCAPEDFGLKTPDLQGHHKAIFRIPADTLMARHYTVAIGLWRESTIYQHVLPALNIEVEPGPSGPYSHESTRAGLVNVTCEWSSFE